MNDYRTSRLFIREKVGDFAAGRLVSTTPETCLVTNAVGRLNATVARALKPIAVKYGIKALEGAGLGMGYQLYKELHTAFGGK